MVLGKRIKELRIESGLTQEEMALVLKVSRPALALYETGRRQIPNELLPVFARYFNVTIDYLFGMED